MIFASRRPFAGCLVANGSRASVKQNVPDDEPEDPKAFVERQEHLHPYRIGQPVQECLGADLEHLGFRAVTFYRAEPHPVFVFRGRIGSSGRTTGDQLRKTIKTTLRERGLTISLTEILVTVTRHRFQAVMTLPVEGLVPRDELPDAIA